MKDFYDIWLMIHLFDVKDSYLIEAIRRTFKHRKTELPKELPIFDEEFYDEQSDR